MSFILFYEIKEQRKITFEEVKMYCSNLVVNIIKQAALTYPSFLGQSSAGVSIDVKIKLCKTIRTSFVRRVRSKRDFGWQGL